jgi:hypothetical protein
VQPEGIANLTSKWWKMSANAEWCLKFGQTYANGLRRRFPRPGDRWQLDELFLKINGRFLYLWRAVDQDGDVLDILVQSRRDKKAAKKFFRNLLKRLQYVPRVIVADQLRSYHAAKQEIMPSVEHRQHKGENNRLAIQFANEWAVSSQAPQGSVLFISQVQTEGSFCLRQFATRIPGIAE